MQVRSILMRYPIDGIRNGVQYFFYIRIYTIVFDAETIID